VPTAPASCALAGALTAGLLLAGCGAETGPAAHPAGSESAGVVVRGHAQPVAGTLAGGGRVRGTLYPALPRANTLRLRVDGAGVGAAASGRMEVAAAMPGMAMRPATATLAARGGRYQGTIVLPMFGRYAARVVVVTPRARRRGTLTLDAPLTLGT